LKKNSITIFLSFLSLLLHAQLQGQMISSQGKTSKVENLIVTQTVGQQSIIGNHNDKNFYFKQGFQQPFWNRLIQSNQPEFSAGFYPNPFYNEITFRFTDLNDVNFNIKIYDTAGRLVYESEKILNDNDLVLNLENFSSGSYLVRLISSKKTFYTKIIKK